MLDSAEWSLILKCFGPEAVLPEQGDDSETALSACMSIAKSSLVSEITCRLLNYRSGSAVTTLFTPGGEQHALHFEARVSFLQTAFGQVLPEPIWTCCKSRCFAKMAMQQPESL